MIREHETLYIEKPREPRNDLGELYRSWGVFDLLQRTIDRLPLDWLRILNISRNLLEGKPIPGIIIPDVLRVLTERNIKTDYERRLVTRRWQEPTEIPSGDIDIRPIETLTELPRVLPPYLLLADAAPDLFTYNAVTGNLPIAENQKPRVVMEEQSETVEELEEVRKAGSSLRQKVYILLDTSISMGDSHKLIFSKAVIMAYFAKAYEEEAQIYFRFFAGDVSDRIDCVSEEQFATLARYVLTVGLYPSTNIDLALQTTLYDVQKIDRFQGSRLATTEILLITDGASRSPIQAIPRNITLHTLHIRDGTEEALDYYDEYPDPDPDQYPDYSDGYSRRAALARIAELKQASKTFTVIDPSHIRLPRADEDAWLLKEEVGRLEQELSSRDLGNAQSDRNLNDRIKKVRRMSTAYQKMYPDRYGLKETKERAKKMEFKLSLKGVKQAIKDALSRRKFAPRRLKGIKTSGKLRLPRTLFDFRIKPED